MATFTERVLILCKTYPSPSASYSETSCVAGLTEAGKLIRLFPVPFRLISDEHQFRKWQWVTALVEKARDDHRPESHRIYVDKIECDPVPLPAGKEGWPLRMVLLSKVPIFSDFDAVQAARVNEGMTLALLRPAKILELEIKATKNPDWSEEEKAKLLQMQQQAGLFDVEERRREVPSLEKIPFDFHYRYECMVDGQPVGLQAQASRLGSRCALPASAPTVRSDWLGGTVPRQVRAATPVARPATSPRDHPPVPRPVAGCERDLPA